MAKRKNKKKNCDHIVSCQVIRKKKILEKEGVKFEVGAKKGGKVKKSCFFDLNDTNPTLKYV